MFHIIFKALTQKRPNASKLSWKIVLQQSCLFSQIINNGKEALKCNKGDIPPFDCVNHIQNSVITKGSFDFSILSSLSDSGAVEESVDYHEGKRQTKEGSSIWKGKGY